LSNLTNIWRQKPSYPFLLSCSLLHWSIHKSCFNNLRVSWLSLLCQFKSIKRLIKFIMMILLLKELRLNMEKNVIQEMIIMASHQISRLNKCGKLINLSFMKMMKTTKINKKPELMLVNLMNSWNGECWQVLHF